MPMSGHSMSMSFGPTADPQQLALGGSVTWSLVSRDLNAVYGRRPVGFWLFLRLRPAAMAH